MQLDADSGTDIVAVSALYNTSPVGGPEQPDFTNAIAIITTDHPPMDLLALVQRIENAHDRQRLERWGPRTLDIDIVAFDELVLHDPTLTIPHPRAHERAFVLVPWLEVDEAAELPGHGRVIDLVGATAEQAISTVGVW
jgi:2-amino-4-hydroxy-6-hydroxymethyldihydropteridine diphosphokinase